MKKNNFILFFIGLVLIIGLSFYFSQVNNAPINSKNDKTNAANISNKQTSQSLTTKSLNLVVATDGKTVSYQGKTGYSAYQLLTEITQVEADNTGFGPIVKSINGVNQTDKEFWLYTVNGKMATVGAHEYQTQDGDLIEWKLSNGQ